MPSHVQKNFSKKMTETIYKPVSKICKNGKYHGCWSIYEDGKRMIIGKNMLCRYPTDNPFWKKPKDVDFKIKTRAQKRKMRKLNKNDILKYYALETDDYLQKQFEININDEIVNYVTAW